MVENPEIVSNKALSIRDQGKTPEKRYGSIPIKTHPTQLQATTEKIALGLSIESSAIDVTALSDKPKNAAITAVANKEKFIVPVKQQQSRMVKNFFETYDKYVDSVFYDASAWSVSNFYNMKSKKLRSFISESEITDTDNLIKNLQVNKSDYAYIIDWNDYNSPAALNHLQKNDIVTYSAFKPFKIKVDNANKGVQFNMGRY